MKKSASKAIKQPELDRRHTAQMLAEQVTLIFQFCGMMIPHKDMIKDVMDASDDRASTTMAMAPVIGAFGGDWEAVQFEANLKAKRAHALYKLIDVLDETEKERVEFAEKQKERAEGRANLARILGASGLM